MKKGLICFLIMIFCYGTVSFAQRKKNNREEAVSLTKKGVVLNNNSKQEMGLYQKAIEADSTYAAPYYNLGNIFFDKEDYDRAIFYYKTACELKPSDKDFWYNLAFAYFKKRDYIPAISSLNIIIKMDQEKKEKDYDAVYLLAKIYSRTQAQTTLNASRNYLLEIIDRSGDRNLLLQARRLLMFVNQKLKIK